MQKKVIIDTDFGGDPDDILALYYCLSSKNIEIVCILTNDEYNGTERAKVLKKWLGLRGINIPIFAGHDLGNTRMFLLQKYVDHDIQITTLFNSNLHTYLDMLVKSKGVYVSIGGLSNLAKLIYEYPSHFARIELFIMGGAIHYRRPGMAEHNIRIDIDAASKVFSAKLSKKWILSDLTFKPEFQISNKHELYRHITSQRDDLFIDLVRYNMDMFYETCYPQSYLHDPLTVTSIFDSTVKFKEESIYFSPLGEFKLEHNRKKTLISDSVDVSLFWKDIKQTLGF